MTRKKKLNMSPLGEIIYRLDSARRKLNACIALIDKAEKEYGPIAAIGKPDAFDKVLASDPPPIFTPTETGASNDPHR